VHGSNAWQQCMAPSAGPPSLLRWYTCVNRPCVHGSRCASRPIIRQEWVQARASCPLHRWLGSRLSEHGCGRVHDQQSRAGVCLSTSWLHTSAWVGKRRPVMSLSLVSCVYALPAGSGVRLLWEQGGGSPRGWAAVQPNMDC
jgi:hypothetical protein